MTERGSEGRAHGKISQNVQDRDGGTSRRACSESGCSLLRKSTVLGALEAIREVKCYHDVYQCSARDTKIQDLKKKKLSCTIVTPGMETPTQLKTSFCDCCRRGLGLRAGAATCSRERHREDLPAEYTSITPPERRRKRRRRPTREFIDPGTRRSSKKIPNYWVWILGSRSRRSSSIKARCPDSSKNYTGGHRAGRGTAAGSSLPAASGVSRYSGSDRLDGRVRQ